MQIKRVPLGDDFVVSGEIPVDFEARVTKVVGATVEPVPGRSNMVVVRRPVRGKNRRDLRRQLAALAGARAVVEPVLIDETGVQLFPTGQLRVSFVKPPSEDALRDFSERHRITLAARNRWQPKLGDFAPATSDDRTTVDIADELSRDADVEAAWPDCVSAFKRE